MPFRALSKSLLPDLTRRPLPSQSGNFPAEFPLWLQSLLLSRQIFSLDDLAADWAHLPAPEQMLGIGKAATLLADAIQSRQSILIVGDYDADGATSCALAVRAISAMGARMVDFLVPDRVVHGYGLGVALAEVAAQSSADLLVTVDNGISSIAGVARARELGMRVLVTDHHLPGQQLPDADAIVNPNQPGCGFPSKALAGVGVMFFVLIATRTELRNRGWFAQNSIEEPNLTRWIDLVALGTVADIVPLDRLNRLLVTRGLERLRSGKGCPGIRALMQVADRDWHLARSRDLGFAVGPRINAAGRLEDISIGIRCLITDDEDRAFELAAELHQINRQRRVLEAQMQQEAETSLQELAPVLQDVPWGVCLYRKDWHQGVIGLLASRIKDATHRPTLILTDAGDGLVKGSGRSIEGLHLRDTLESIATAAPGIFTQFGGHAMAAGLSMPAQRVDELVKLFDESVREQLDESQLQMVLQSDGPLPPDALTLDSAQQLDNLLPWGQSCPEPLFDGRFRIVSVRILKEQHLKMRLQPDSADTQIDAIWFRAPADAMSLGSGVQVHLAYRLQVNDYRGVASPQLQIEAMV